MCGMAKAKGFPMIAPQASPVRGREERGWNHGVSELSLRYWKCAVQEKTHQAPFRK